jgi:wobble nucleotide-excising tRNase
MMKFIFTAAILLFSLFVAPLVDAQKLYSWTDENGVLHITEQPPPKGAKVEDVMTYRERTPEELRAIERSQNMEQRDFDKYLQEEKAREAGLKAEEADEKARKAREQAEEDYRKNKAYIDKLSNRRWKRKKFRKRIDRLKRETEESLAEAQSAAEEAEKAKKTAAELAQDAQ